MEENIMLELLLSEEEAAKQQLSKQKVVEIAREICPEEYMGMGFDRQSEWPLEQV